MKVWDQAEIKLATPGSAVRLASVARHVTDCAMRPVNNSIALNEKLVTTLYILGNLSSADFFFKIIFFQKIFSGTLSECQAVWIQIRTDILTVLIWVNGLQWLSEDIYLFSLITRTHLYLP